MLKKRNPFACAPIMKKGGAHVKSKSSQRAIANKTLDDEIDEYYMTQGIMDEASEENSNRLIGLTDESDYKLIGNI